MSSGSLVSFIYYSIAAGVSIGGIAELFSELQKPAAAAERVFEYINDKQLPNSHTHKALPLTISGNNSTIGFHNVGFYYPSRPDNMVLNNVSFNINLGKFIGIVGRSGSGKSTIFQLLMKFYHIEDGDITVDNQNLEELDTILLRNKIAYVPQEPSIFSGTIKSNISFSNPNATEEMILSVARLCGVTDFISSFSEGLNTEIGERGVRLSGGQKQRIAIARALLYNPEILLLDEATSSIDSEGEQQVINSIIEFLKGKTIISIAHRIASLERADNILVIDKNHFIAEGNHLDLVNNCEIYRTLYEEQKI
jgi:ATP-binding cassette subfamily B protein